MIYATLTLGYPYTSKLPSYQTSSQPAQAKFREDLASSAPLHQAAQNWDGLSLLAKEEVRC